MNSNQLFKISPCAHDYAMYQVPSFSHGITIYGKLNHIEINASNYHVLSMFISAIWYFVYINT